MCANTSLARKEDKLGFSVQHSPGSTIHFISHCSISSKPLTKFQKFIRPTRFLRQELPSYRKKNGEHSVLFSLKGTGGSPTGPDPGNMVGDQDIGIPGTPVPSGLQVPGEPGICRRSPRFLNEIPTSFFLQHILQLCQQK